jgi:hypothetical protein
VEQSNLVCLACGRALPEAEAPAFVTVVAGQARALCEDCADRPSARRAVAALLGVSLDDLAHFLDVPEHLEPTDEESPLPPPEHGDEDQSAAPPQRSSSPQHHEPGSDVLGTSPI